MHFVNLSLSNKQLLLGLHPRHHLGTYNIAQTPELDLREGTSWKICGEDSEKGRGRYICFGLKPSVLYGR